MKKNGEYVGVDEKFIPEDEKYVDESLLGNKEESKRKIKKVAKGIGIGYLAFFGVILVIFLVVFITAFKFIGGTFTKVNDRMDDFDQRSTSMREDYDSQVNDMMDSYNVSAFNNGLKSMQGTQSKFMLSSYLDKIVTSNKTNSNHIITVTYNETTTTTEDGIVGIKHSLNDNSKYEVSLDYDANGYINKVTIKDI